MTRCADWNWYGRRDAPASTSGRDGESGAPERCLVFEVTDTGCGVAKEGLCSLFKEYVQARPLCRHVAHILELLCHLPQAAQTPINSRCIALYFYCLWPVHCCMSAPKNTADLQGHSICQLSLSSMWGVEGEVCICIVATACGTGYAKSVTVQLNWCTQLLKAPTKHGGPRL